MYLLQIDAINDRFTEAREEISIAQDDAETTYFDESHAEAQKVSSMYHTLLASHGCLSINAVRALFYMRRVSLHIRQVVGDALEMYTELVNSLEENERGTLQRQMGLKMEQLKQELALLDTLHD